MAPRPNTHRSGKKPGTQKGGKKCKYFDFAANNLDKIRDWSAKGFCKSRIAKCCGVSIQTFMQWLTKYPELAMVIGEGEEERLERVEEALLRRANGYTYLEEVLSETTDGDGDIIHRTERKSKKHMAASTRAIEMYLKNRAPDRWNKEPDKIDISGGVLMVPDTAEKDWNKQVIAQQKELEKSAREQSEDVFKG